MHLRCTVRYVDRHTAHDALPFPLPAFTPRCAHFDYVVAVCRTPVCVPTFTRPTFGWCALYSWLRWIVTFGLFTFTDYICPVVVRTLPRYVYLRITTFTHLCGCGLHTLHATDYTFAHITLLIDYTLRDLNYVGRVSAFIDLFVLPLRTRCPSWCTGVCAHVWLRYTVTCSYGCCAFVYVAHLPRLR